MLNPSDGSSFFCPSLTHSPGNNLKLMATGQLFFGKEGTDYGELGKAVYGSINLLSYGSAEESMMRIESNKIAFELIEGLEKNEIV